MKPKRVKERRARRIADYEASMSRMKLDKKAKGYTRPGSFKK